MIREFSINWPTYAHAHADGDPSAEVNESEYGEDVCEDLEEAADDDVVVEVAGDEAARVEGEAVVDKAVSEEEVVHDEGCPEEAA